MALSDRRRRSRRRSRAPIPATPLRIALVGAMGTVLAAVASRAFGQIEWALLAAPPIVTVAALVGRSRRPIERAVILAVGVIAGTIVAGLLGGADAGGLVDGPITGAKRLLTTEWPSPRDPLIVVSLALMLSVITAVATAVATYRRLHIAPLIAIAVGLTLAMAAAAPVHPPTWTLIALGALALVVTVLRPGDDLRARTRALLADPPFAAAVGVIAATAVVAGSTIALADRADPRDPDSPETSASLLDPVEEMVALREAEPSFGLFRIVDRSTLVGPSLPARWRLSALDVYDGQRWTPGVALRPIGTILGTPSPARPDIPPPIQFDVELLSDDLDLVPIPGRPLAVDTGSSLGVETDLARTVVRLAEEPRPGLTIRASAEAAPGLTAARGSTLGTRQVDELSAGFTETATTLGGEGTILERLQTIEATMRDEWELDPQAPGGGQQLNLIQRFVEETGRGTEEQFVTAFVLLARSLGVHARVATGFVVPPGELSSPLELRSTHAAVWPEVEVIGRGWMAFDPVPEQVAADEATEPPPPAAQSPSAAQPPIDPPTDPAEQDDTEVVDDDTDESRWSRVQAWARNAGVVVGTAVLPFLIAIGLILGLKWRRRRRRLRAADPGRRIVGAWANTADSLVDAGLTIRPAWTNEAIAEHGSTLAPGVPHEMLRLASAATAVTFGDERAQWDRASDAVAVWRSVEAAIRSERTRWQRIRWRLSLRSLRRATRSPVVA